MQKVHITVLYLGLVLSAVALVLMLLAYVDQQTRIVALEEREQATDDWLNALSNRVEGMDTRLQGTQQSINDLAKWSEEVSDWQNGIAAWSHSIAQWQSDVADSMNRTQQQGVPAEWESWRRSVDRRISSIQSNASNNKADIDSLYSWSNDVTAYLNTGQQTGVPTGWEVWAGVSTGELPALKRGRTE